MKSEFLCKLEVELKQNTEVSLSREEEFIVQRCELVSAQRAEDKGRAAQRARAQRSTRRSPTGPC